MSGDVANAGALWASLVNTATIGVDRVGAGSDQSDNLYGAVFHLDSDASPGDELLDRVAALAVYVAAGQAAEPIRYAFTPVVDDLEPCVARAGLLLLTILNGEHGALLEAWCRLARQRGQRVPHELLAAVLDAAVKGRRERHEDVAAVIGARGRWLASQNKRWAIYAECAHEVDPTSDAQPLLEAWETGPRQQRIEAMVAMRQADPAAARAVLLGTLAQDSAADRAAFVGTLAIGLSTADEPALEGLLDDRSSQVRDVAADLLSLIEGAALSHRMVVRMEQVVVYTPPTGKLRKKSAQLTLNLPGKLDDQAERDAIREKAAQKMGAKAAAMSHVIARTPLAWWEQMWPDAEGWVGLALASDWSTPLIVGWARAAHLQRNAEWSKALIGRVCLAAAGKRAVMNENWRGERLNELITHLDAADIQALIDAHLPAKAGQTIPGELIELLRACPGPWRVDLSERVLRLLQQTVQHPEVVYDNALRSFIDHVAGARIAIELADRVSEGWPTDARHWSANFEALIDRFIRTVGLRQQMHDAFTNS